jgi:hypothetical protein
MVFLIIALLCLGALVFAIKENTDKFIDWIPLNWIKNLRVQNVIRVTLKVITSLVLGIFYIGLMILFIVLVGASESSKKTKNK